MFRLCHIVGESLATLVPFGPSTCLQICVHRVSAALNVPIVSRDFQLNLFSSAIAVHPESGMLDALVVPESGSLDTVRCHAPGRSKYHWAVFRPTMQNGTCLIEAGAVNSARRFFYVNSGPLQPRRGTCGELCLRLPEYRWRTEPAFQAQGSSRLYLHSHRQGTNKQDRRGR